MSIQFCFLSMRTSSSVSEAFSPPKSLQSEGGCRPFQRVCSHSRPPPFCFPVSPSKQQGARGMLWISRVSPPVLTLISHKVVASSPSTTLNFFVNTFLMLSRSENITLELAACSASCLSRPCKAFSSNASSCATFLVFSSSTARGTS